MGSGNDIRFPQLMCQRVLHTQTDLPGIINSSVAPSALQPTPMFLGSLAPSSQTLQLGNSGDFSYTYEVLVKEQSLKNRCTWNCENLQMRRQC